MDFFNKQISVIGAVRSGVAAASLIKRLGGRPFVSDQASEQTLVESAARLNKEGIEFEAGGHSNRVYDCEVMVVSPGVPLSSEVILNARQKGIHVISELELAAEACKGYVIGITGTNGKTTTTSLTAHILNTAGFNTYSAGNIGYAFSEIADKVKPDEFVALEISSFQLDLIDRFKPEVSTILNITPDHLDRYENSFEKYVRSKYRIFKNQNGSDVTVLNADDESFTKFPVDINTPVKTFSIKEEQKNGAWFNGSEIIYNESGLERFRISADDIALRGEHNLANAMSVIIMAEWVKVPLEKLVEGLRSFKPVEHRLEPVTTHNGVLYINDSKATNVESVWYALRSFRQPILLILGGRDKGNDYSRIRDLVEEKVKKVFAIGESAQKVKDAFQQVVDVEMVSSMRMAVESAKHEAAEGDVVLLSPACASFDMYKSYEHRGKVFKEAVQEVTG